MKEDTNLEEFESIIDELERLKDTRDEWRLSHTLQEIIFLVLCAQLSGFESLLEYKEYGEEKIDFLRSYYPYKNGIPSRSTIYRVLSILDPKYMNDILKNWIRLTGSDNHIAIDGKTHCGDRKERKTHLVSACATESGLIIGQTKVKEKTNEIVAIPQLINALEIEDHIVSIDAMGCQKEIAALIIKKKAHYVFALKRNHLNLFEDVDLYFSDHQNERNVFEDIDKSRGRVEIRKCSLSKNIAWLSQKKEWAKLKTIVMIESTIYVKQKEHTEKRYYISDLDVDPKTMLKYVRAHWAIEANHWVLSLKKIKEY